jgi:hypothetical protein
VAQMMKYKKVNWVNGMKITKSHFLQQDNSNVESNNALAASNLNEFNYGLIRSDLQKSDSLSVVFIIDNQQFLRISVFDCQALTPSGARIDISNTKEPMVFEIDLIERIDEASKEDGLKEYYIALSIDPFESVPIGPVVDHEDPPRFSFAIPTYKTHIFSKDELARTDNIAFSLFIGKLSLGKNHIEVIEGYIPASISMKSHPDLTEFHAEVERFFGQLELHLINIIKKVREKKQETRLALSVVNLAMKLLDHISIFTMSLKWDLCNRPPIQVFCGIASFARIMKNIIDTNSAAAREEMINYFTNWSELKQGDFEKLLTYCVNFTYDHFEIELAKEQFQEFITIIESLFKKMASLAYIGKKKDTNIFVKEHKTKRSFLAD